ncbi:MAG TPA: beta-ketoacyl-ACP synthase [Xanthobacteraceae bacterium]|nr:beta-ketoacyl-ACP synthase [Xanthobacteraceae bacterium]
MSARREVWVTGVGLLTCLGEGLEANWARLESGDTSVHDDKSFAPYIVHPLAPMSFDKFIPKKSDQRQMETWQRVGVYTAGMALADANVAGNAELLDRADMIVAAGGGERDTAVDTAIMAGVRKTNQPGAFLNERLMSDLRPTLFLAQLPNLLAGNISLVHGVVGSSRTFMGEEAAGVDAVRVAQARIAAGQSELTLVGGAYNGARWDVLLAFELGGVVLKDKFAPVWDRGPEGGIAFATIGAFLVLESSDHAKARGARPRAKISQVFSDRNVRKAGQAEASLRRQWDALAPQVDRAHAAIISGASGFEPATSAELSALKNVGLPVRNTGTYIGHGVDTQFMANLGIGCAVLEHGKLFAAAGSGDTGQTPAGLSQIVVTSVGNWRGEGLALLERVN